jgi:RNA polymerase sigma-70 factor (ECF subfamily)
MYGEHDTPERRFDQLYNDTSDDVLAYLLRRAQSHEDAADALAETYAAAWRKLESLPEGDRARLWLFGAARNELHRTTRRRRAEDDLDRTLATDRSPSWEYGTEAEDGNEATRDALASLSRLDYEIVTLTAWEDLKPREIAVVLGLSANVIRIRLHRARGQLRALLTGDPRLKTPTAPMAERAGG